MTKELFCKELCSLLHKTDQYEDLVELSYSHERDGEYVTPYWWDSVNQRKYAGRRIDVTADSETAIIKDVLRGIE